MISMENLFKLSQHRRVEDAVLEELFEYERSTLITTILLETILLYILTPLIGNIIIAWYGVILSLTLWRLYNAYDYRNNPKRNSPLVWHEKFVVQVWSTALLFSLLALFAVPQLDAYYQLFTFIVLLGISSGAIKALSSDHRTAIGYLIIILFPLIVEMLLLGRRETWILAFLVAIYLFVQIKILLQSYTLSVEARCARQEMEKAQEALHEKQEIIRRFLERTEDAVFLYDRHGHLIDINPAFEAMFDVSQDEARKYTLSTFPNLQWSAMVRQALNDPNGIYADVYRTSSYETLWLEVRCAVVDEKEENHIGGVGLIRDKTAEHRSQEELTRMATTDWMTGVANRLGFQQFIHDLMHDPRHRTHASLFFYMDINRFKQINDLYGHETGDNVIKAVTERFKEITPKQALLTRLGGDEFSLVIPHVSSKEETYRSHMQMWSETLLSCFKDPFVIEGRVFDIRCSIGAVYIDPGEEDFDRVVSRADLAMYQAKRHESGVVVVYDPSLEEGQCPAYEVHHTLGDAIAKDQLTIAYQPIVESRTERARAAEALVRWQHPEKGLLDPREFLPVAVLSGQVTQVDRWMLDAVVEQVAEWKATGVFSLDYVSINIDVQSLTSEGFIADFLAKLQEHGVEGSEIRLELLEFSISEHFETVKEKINELSRYGVSCIVDDFGAGCLSLYHLKTLPVSAIKTDRIFVRDLHQQIENVLLIQTLIEMAQKFRYDIIVKGIETSTARKMVTNLNPSILLQGDFESEPLSVETFTGHVLGEG